MPNGFSDEKIDVRRGGFLFLAEPLKERVAIQDLRSIGGELLERPSPDLLDVLYLCQRRQAWHRGYAGALGVEPPRVVGGRSKHAQGTEVGQA